jgi:hypothetical protein
MHKKPPPDKKTGAQKRPGRPHARHNAQSITQLIDARPALRRLANALPLQQSWADWLASLVPAELSLHIVSVVPKDGELVVFADSAVWGTRLRYALVPLQAQITARDPTVRQIRLRVQVQSRSKADSGR